MFQELLERTISFKEVGVIYKLFLECIESHYVFKSVFESIMFVLVLPDDVSDYLLERKVGY